MTLDLTLTINHSLRVSNIAVMSLFSYLALIAILVGGFLITLIFLIGDSKLCTNFEDLVKKTYIF